MPPATPDEIRDACAAFVKAGDAVRAAQAVESVSDNDESEARTRHANALTQLAQARAQLAQAEIKLRDVLGRGV